MDIIIPGPGKEQFERALGVPMPTSSAADEFLATLRSNGRRSLYYFSTAVLGWNKIKVVPHKEMADFAQEVPPTYPHRKRRKVVLIPRDCFKSTLFSKSFPLWILIQQDFCGLPGLEHRILLSSFSSVNAQKQLISIQQQVERNETLRMLYPEIIPDLAKTKWTTTNLRFPRDGMYGEDTIEAAGVDTHIVSRHYTVQIKDDLEDKQSMEQPSVRERVKTFYRSAEALFVEEQTAYDLLVGTRWGVDDVYSEIFEREAEHYERLVRPLHWTQAELRYDLDQADEAGKPSVYDMDPETYAPDPAKTYYFFPEIFPPASCARVKAKQGSFMYSMLYLNNPKDPSLAEFFPDRVVRFRMTVEGDIVFTNPETEQKEIILFDSLKRVLFWDPAMSERDPARNSRNAIVAAGKDAKGRIIILDAYAEHKNSGYLCSKFIGMHQRWACHKAAVEDVNFSRLLKFPIYQRMRELEYTFPVEEQTPIGDKDHRIRTLIPYNESFLLLVRDGLTAFMEELKSFPLTNLKDLLDAGAACLPLLGSVRTTGQNATRKQSNLQAVESARLSTRDATTGY